MEKAKNINDLLEEYERMEAIIDLFFKKDVENQELEELRRWLTVSINYFRRFQKVLSILKIKDEKINIKEAEEKGDYLSGNKWESTAGMLLDLDKEGTFKYITKFNFYKEVLLW